MFCKKNVHLNFAKFTGKHLYGSFFLLNLQAYIFNFPVTFQNYTEHFFIEAHQGITSGSPELKN